MSTNDLQRQLALSRYSDWVNTASGRSKSKSPRRGKRDQHTEQLPSPPHSPRQTFVSEPDTISPPTRPPFPPAHSHKISSASSPYPGRNSSTPKVLRRPHTSAGPRDWPSTLDARENVQNESNRSAVPPRPETAHPTHFPKSPPNTRGPFRQQSAEPSRLGSSSTVSSGGHLTVESSQHRSHGGLFERANLGDVQAWERELARIESASRRNSADMLGFLSQRKKASVEQSSIPMYLHAEG